MSSVLPPFFTVHSRALPHRVHVPFIPVQTGLLIPVQTGLPFADTLARYRMHPSPPTRGFIHRFKGKLQEVFMTSIPRASHQPAALCGLSKSLLILFNADLYGYFR